MNVNKIKRLLIVIILIAVAAFMWWLLTPHKEYKVKSELMTASGKSKISSKNWRADCMILSSYFSKFEHVRVDIRVELESGAAKQMVIKRNEDGKTVTQDLSDGTTAFSIEMDGLKSDKITGLLECEEGTKGMVYWDVYVTESGFQTLKRKLSGDNYEYSDN